MKNLLYFFVFLSAFLFGLVFFLATELRRVQSQFKVAIPVESEEVSAPIEMYVQANDAAPTKNDWAWRNNW